LKLRELQKKKQLELSSSKDNSLSTGSQDNRNQLTAARLRLQNDLNNLELPPGVNLSILSVLSDLKESPHLTLLISPDEGYYKSGKFKFDLKFNENYPIEPPIVLCMNKIFHPNIDLDGKICLNILREDWSPALDLNSIIIGLLYLFLECNAKDPLNKEAANILHSDEDMFRKYVRDSMAGKKLFNIQYDNVL
ncbi:hypothetical protein Kpol_414p2, partial [Vanderwaltozyma polyspora DSM 70294]